MLRNNSQQYGLLTILLHWIMALLVIGLFVLGLYMTSLNYYDPWYHAAPWWHKSFGITVFLLLIVRSAWTLSNPKPLPLSHHQAWEVWLAKLVHRLLYLLLYAICISGYLISTAKGKAIDFFYWVEVPALTAGSKGQEDLAGDIHYVLAISAACLVVLHVAGGLKHHFIDRDATLKRMLFWRAPVTTNRGD